MKTGKTKMELSNADKKHIQMVLRIHGIKNTNGLKIALMPLDDGSIDLVLIPSGLDIANYELEAGETIEEFAKCVQDFLEGSEVRAPSVVAKGAKK